MLQPDRNAQDSRLNKVGAVEPEPMNKKATALPLSYTPKLPGFYHAANLTSTIYISRYNKLLWNYHDTLLHNRYRIIRLLGQGGWAAFTWLMTPRSISRWRFKVNFRVGEDSSTQFTVSAAARVAAALALPRVIDYFVIANNQFLVMDYIPGEDLGTLIAREGRQPVERVKAWAKQLGEALVYLHGQHPPVVHRDIKPANIKITPSGDLVLVDFGIAKATDASQSTSTGASGYTPGFAPPEQYGATRTGPYTDQFSFAATLYMLLTGERPADSIGALSPDRADPHPATTIPRCLLSSSRRF